MPECRCHTKCCKLMETNDAGLKLYQHSGIHGFCPSLSVGVCACVCICVCGCVCVGVGVCGDVCGCGGGSVFVCVCTYINAGMPDSLASDPSGTRMNKTNDAGTSLEPN
jgi:hypothetical protein